MPGRVDPVADRTRREVVVTGLGLITPVGIGVEKSWEALLAGVPGGGPVTHFELKND
jgi:3-oxoacyl-[acyl-carrier-protein] synthase II